MEEATRELVRERARDRCENCGIAQHYYPDFTFHIEHVVSRQHRGGSGPENLALACHLCNLKKGPNLSGLDPDSGELTALFNPRTDAWNEHFALDPDGQIVGVTAVGRTTVYVLGLNSELRVQIRRQVGERERRSP